VPQPAQVPFPRAQRHGEHARSRVAVGDVIIGDGTFTIIGGPCSVESREQILATADAVAAAGGVMLRGGAFKPRTSPYAFQGLGWEGVALLAEAGRASGLPTVSEVMSIDQVERMAASVDLLQIGARNMQNFDLLKAVGKTSRPVLLKRGMAASIDELLAAAEYVLSEGNPNVILCERGIRTFETATRNTLDLSAVPVLRERTHLPVLVDPSHGVGVRRWIAPLCRAAKAVGAHGLLIEVHPNPAEAKCDADQALTFSDFAQLVRELAAIPDDVVGPDRTRRVFASRKPPSADLKPARRRETLGEADQEAPSSSEVYRHPDQSMTATIASRVAMQPVSTLPSVHLGKPPPIGCSGPLPSIGRRYTAPCAANGSVEADTNMSCLPHATAEQCAA
jgi:3-deoxy-7-phosphoheptulonate synthase